jgi:23S rRNA pseudouridine1911/1915/1917 synthase
MSNEDLYRLHELKAPDGDLALFSVLADTLPRLSRSLARKAVHAGLVLVNGEPCSEPQRPLASGTTIRCDFRQGIEKKYQLTRFAPPEDELPFKILFHDEDIVILDKAAGVLSAPTEKGERGAVSEYLRRWLRAQGDKRPFTGYIHRLDKETSGCLCFARNRRAQKALSVQFAKHGARRRYRCIVLGSPRQEHDTLTGRIGRGRDGRRAVVADNHPGKNAVTHFEVVQHFDNASELRIRLETGRTHQIRIHMAHIGCPILGEPVYGEPHAKAQRAPRMMLHATQLDLEHPATGRRMHFTADLPDEFSTFLDSLKSTEPTK